MKRLGLLVSLVLLGSCSLNQPDHFYVLDSGPPGTLGARTHFVTQVSLRVTLPSLVDRSEMVLANQTGVQVLEHERWAAPLGDLFAQVLGQDIEARREDVILSSRRIARSSVPSATIAIDVVRLSLQRGLRADLEVRWRLETGAGNATQGRQTFTSPVAGGTIGALSRSLSICIGELADRLVTDLPR